MADGTSDGILLNSVSSTHISESNEIINERSFFRPYILNYPILTHIFKTLQLVLNTSIRSATTITILWHRVRNQEKESTSSSRPWFILGTADTQTATDLTVRSTWIVLLLLFQTTSGPSNKILQSNSRIKRIIEHSERCSKKKCFICKNVTGIGNDQNI